MVLLQSDMYTLKKGSKAPDFSLKNVDRTLVSLNDLKGKALVIIFMCNHCPYVKPKMQEIADMQKKYAPTGVVDVCISSNDVNYVEEDSFEHMQELAKKFGYKYYLYDESQDVARSYGATCTPDPFVFDKDHKLVYHGRINDAMNPDDKAKEHTLQLVLDKMISGQKVDPWFVYSQGCSIKWKPSE